MLQTLIGQWINQTNYMAPAFYSMFFMILFFIFNVLFPFASVKWPKENEWMIDPVVIADIYGAEV